MKDIKIVIGANFGDEGKGKLTDYYTKDKDNCIVVCSNGGAQRGHTVLKPDGTRHVFHHFGSGTLNGADTYLPGDFILNPLVFREEWEELKKLGWEPHVYVHEKCMITNPFDMMNEVAVITNTEAAEWVFIIQFNAMKNILIHIHYHGHTIWICSSAWELHYLNRKKNYFIP